MKAGDWKIPIWSSASSMRGSNIRVRGMPHRCFISGIGSRIACVSLKIRNGWVSCYGHPPFGLLSGWTDMVYPEVKGKTEVEIEIETRWKAG
jgi:hypothetical protein